MLCTEKKGIFDCTKLSLVTSRGKTKRKNTISQVFFNKQYFNALHTTMQLEFPKPIRIAKGWIRKYGYYFSKISRISRIQILLDFFLSDKPPQRANSAHVACSQAGTWAVWAEVARQRGVSYDDWNQKFRAPWNCKNDIFFNFRILQLWNLFWWAGRT